MINNIISIAKEAGLAIMQVYNKKLEIEIEIKNDLSPLTEADLISNEIIIKGLSQCSSHPIITEESPVEYQQRQTWDKFWLVDPLDGTKDFIERTGGFTVNIALIENKKPILGVVYDPFRGDIYYATQFKGAYKNGAKIFNTSRRIDLVGGDSNFHSTQTTKSFFEQYKIKQIIRLGSSLKICKLAEGEIDVYPRLNGTKEWDTAASHIIANEAGCKLIDITTNSELTYNKKSIDNNFFIASRNDLEFTI